MRHRLRLSENRMLEFHHMEMMGIVNATTDSFFAGSRADSLAKAMELVKKHIDEGARMIDIGGESTRPGASPVEEEEEIRRICPIIGQVKKEYPGIIVSADTYRAKTAEAALEAGADIINDISGFTFDPEIAKVIAGAGAAAVIMHTGGRPEVMQKDPHYDDVVEEVYVFLEKQIGYAVSCGVGKDQIMIDVGIGFGKTVEHNLALLANIGRFRDLDCPHLMAVSRKSFIGKVLQEREEAPLPEEDRLTGTTAVTAYGALNGIQAARVHDVRANRQAARMVEAICDNRL